MISLFPARVPGAAVPASAAPVFDRFYRVQKYKSGLAGKRCRVLARGKLNSALVEFEDGQLVITNRFAIRKVVAR